MMRKTLFALALLISGLSSSASEYTIPRLSPLPDQPERITLSGQWKFNPAPAPDFWTAPESGTWSPIEVPGEWVMQGFEVEKGAPPGYLRSFTVPVDWKNRRIKLRCNGIFSESTIYINGKEAGYHLGGFTPFELDVTPLISLDKENRIAIRVTSETVADSAASAARYAVHPLGGITRDIYLFSLPEVNLSSFHTSTAFDATYTDAVLTAEVGITNESARKAENLNLLFTLRDAAGKNIELKKNKLDITALEAHENLQLKETFDVVRPEQWNSEHPYLYTFTCQLRDGDQVLHTTRKRVGFRQIEIRGNEMFINNKPVKLRGVCRHEVHPLRGRALTPDIYRKDVELFKKGNVNYIRTSHYPPDEALLEVCDELGMFVEMEAPFCWAHETQVPENKHYAVLINQHIEMVNRDRSHPSVIIWSLGNESTKYDEYFKRSGEIIREIDPTRPRIFSQWGPDADNNELEIGNHHYPGPGGPNQYRNSKRPIVFDEFCHLNAYNRFELAADPGMRDAWGKLLDDMWNDMYNSKGVLGGALWAGIDDTFFLPGGKAVGYGTWGPIDGWRREKPEYWGMKKAFSPVRITPKGNPDANGELEFDIENRFNFTDLSDCRIIRTTNNHDQTVKLNLAPRSKGSFKVQLAEFEREAKHITFTITDAEGYAVDKYTFRIAPDIVQETAQVKRQKLTLKEDPAFYTISSGKTTLTVHKGNGLINVLDQGKPVITDGPALMILPLNGEGDGIQMTGKDQNYKPYNPACENWVCSSIRIEKGKEAISVIIEGEYQEANGRYTYTLNHTGELSVAYRFTVKKEISPRQVGLRFTLPTDFMTLSWKRQGYWNTYPADHIGALSGKVNAFDSSLPISGIAGPDRTPAKAWAYDQTLSGSNLFRSTKENILTASLSNNFEISTITVISDGSQHTRSWVDPNSVKLLVADYTNPGSERFLVPHAEKYYHPLRIGDVVSGTVHLKLTENQAL